jgi:hypothetical protein
MKKNAHILFRAQGSESKELSSMPKSSERGTILEESMSQRYSLVLWLFLIRSKPFSTLLTLYS